MYSFLSDVNCDICSSQNHRHEVIDGRVSGGGGVGSHQYVHNTPADYKYNYMCCSGVFITWRGDLP